MYIKGLWFCTQIREEPNYHIAVIISPLRALVRDQVFRWTTVGLTAAAIQPEAELCYETKQGECYVYQKCFQTEASL